MTLLAEIADSRPRTLPDLREEVREHLLRMCSTRRGSFLLAPDYGVDDPTHLFHSFPGGLDDWLNHRRKHGRHHEPRHACWSTSAAHDSARIWTSPCVYRRDSGTPGCDACRTLRSGAAHGSGLICTAMEDPLVVPRLPASAINRLFERRPPRICARTTRACRPLGSLGSRRSGDRARS